MSKNVSIRGARLQFRERFQAAVREFQTIAILCEAAKETALADAAAGADTVEEPPTIVEMFKALPVEIVTQILSYNLGSTPTTNELVKMCWNPIPVPGDKEDKRFRIAVRKRPIWPTEVKAGEFDSLTVSGERSQCVLHDTRLDRDHKTFTDHREFAQDNFFSEAATNPEVFEQEVRPLLEKVLSGGRATFVAFGQTGTGKTHTVHGVEEELARAIFNPPAGSVFLKVAAVEVVVFEMRGKENSDLLDNRKSVKLLQGGDGQMHVSGAKRVRATSPEALLAAFNAAHKLRSTSATTKNAQSSRSHALCRLQFIFEEDEAVATTAAGGAARGAVAKGKVPAPKKRGGVLTLVDLAGSERNEDTSKHTKEEAREAAEINTSLMTLKECFRAVTEKVVEQEVVIERRTSDGKVVYLPYNPAAAEEEKPEDDSSAVERIVMRAKRGGKEKEMKMPFRNHQLTNFLKDCFLNSNHRTVVIAAVSPLASDVEHTRRTLELVCSMRGAQENMLRVTRACAKNTERETNASQPVVKWDALKVAKWVKNFNARHANGASSSSSSSSSSASAVPAVAAAAPSSASSGSSGKENVGSKPGRNALELPKMDGKEFMRLPIPRLVAYCGGDKALANLAFKAIREENTATSQAAFDRRKSMISLLRGEDDVKTNAAAAANEANEANATGC